ncbi:1-acyl-sn-glycerol-3-phosphate acyltransferase alpha-like isoform X2 [Apostichopus japonicus]|uniref:1-acyl-sn-glycerol-3-phosphate acyltransferase alpha-like isoform X2 n=1 Tax=Stichopus japonicus TaxID=307972 RepID=UPI003AB7E9C6
MGQVIPSNWSLGWSQLVMIIIAACVILKFRRTIIFYTKYILYLNCFMIIGSLTSILMLTRPGHRDNLTRWAGLFTRYSVKYIYGIKINIFGSEHLKTERPFIIVCNHQSSVDNVGMMEIIPRYTICMMKKSLKYAGPFGLAAILCGSIFVDRSKPEKAKQAMEDTIKIILKEKVNLWMFPEGHRNMMKQREDHMLPFKKGAFNIAVKAQIPIVPIVLSSQEPFFSFKHRRFTSGTQNIEVLPPVPTEGLTLDNVPELSEQIRKDMIESFVRISPNLQSNSS